MNGRLDRIGPYEVIGLLGEGGMGRVYRARDPRFDRMVAVKVLHPHLASSPEVARRFNAEAVIQAKLRHPNIVAVYDFVAESETLAIVMECIEGRSLEKVISDSGGPLTSERCVALMSQVPSAMAYAHEQRLVHRDVKPSNILVETILGEEHAKVMDFGIAKILGDDKLRTATGAKMGTLAYMSPEQVKSPKAVDARSDIYSLGATLYEMATGRAPFDAESEFELMQRIVGEELLPPSRVSDAISPSLDVVVLRAMSKRPEDRYSACEQFRSALQTTVVPAVRRTEHPPPLMVLQGSGPSAVAGLHNETGARQSARCAIPIASEVGLSSLKITEGMSSRKRTLAAAGLITVLGVVLAIVIMRLAPSFFGMSTTQEGEAGGREVASLADLMAEGNRLVGAGSFAEALGRYREVIRRHPASEAARDAFAKTEVLLADKERATAQGKDAEAPLSTKRDAIRVPGGLKATKEADATLTVDSGDAEARSLRGGARAGVLSAERKKKAGVLKSGEESTSGGAGAASAALLPYPATEKVIISFASPIAEGHVMVSLNDRFIFRKSFSFGKESNGGLVEGRADIPIGRGSFKVWVIAPDRSVNQFRELAAIVSAGETKTLHLDLDTARNLSVSFR